MFNFKDRINLAKSVIRSSSIAHDLMTILIEVIILIGSSSKDDQKMFSLFVRRAIK